MSLITDITAARAANNTNVTTKTTVASIAPEHVGGGIDAAMGLLTACNLDGVVSLGDVASRSLLIGSGTTTIPITGCLIDGSTQVYDTANIAYARGSSIGVQRLSDNFIIAQIGTHADNTRLYLKSKGVDEGVSIAATDNLTGSPTWVFGIQAGNVIAACGSLNAPTITPGPAAGIGATISIEAGSDERKGAFSVITGSSTMANNTLATITFATPYPRAITAVISPANIAAAVRRAFYVTDLTTTGFKITHANPVPPTTMATYRLSYVVML